MCAPVTYHADLPARVVIEPHPATALAIAVQIGTHAEANAATAELVRRYRGYLTGQHIGAIPADELAALADEAVWTAARRYDITRGCSLGQLASVILRRRVADHHRQHRRQTRGTVAAEMDAIADDTSDRTDGQLDDADDLARLRRRLRRAERDVLTLHLAGHTQREIVTMLATNRDAVQDAMSEIRRQARRDPAN